MILNCYKIVGNMCRTISKIVWLRALLFAEIDNLGLCDPMKSFDLAYFGDLQKLLRVMYLNAKYQNNDIMFIARNEALGLFRARLRLV